MMNDLSDVKITRRDLLIAGAISATTAAVPSVAGAQNNSNSSGGGGGGAPAQAAAAPVMNKVTLVVNGQSRAVEVDTRTTLLDVLRENMHLTGTKKGCDHGQCGARTVIVEGRRINSCLSLAVMHDGDKITTIEGLGTPDKLHPMQAAFVKHDGYQCGYCTPGQICSAISAIEEIKQGIPSHVTADLNTKPLLSSEELRERMSGNICRCGAYSNIIDAINDVAGSRA